MKHRVLLPLAVLCGAALALSPLRPVRAADAEVVSDDWDLLRINGAPAGHIRTLVKRVGTAEAPELETTTESLTEIKRAGDKMVIESSSVVRERPDGSLVSARQTQKASGVETLVEVSFADGKALIATTAMGRRGEKSVAVPEGTVGPYKAGKVPVDAKLDAGDRHEIKTFAVELGGPVVLTVTVGGEEEVDTLTGKQRLIRTEVKLGTMPVTLAWLTADGTPIASKTVIMGMTMEGLRGTKEQVLAAKEGKGGTPEVFEASLIKTRHLVPHARVADEALFRIHPKQPDVDLKGLEDERQQVASKEADGSVMLRVSRVVPAAGATGKRPLAEPSAEVAPYLVATSMLQADDPLIQKSAAQAVGAETDAWKAAQAIERWVNVAINDKNMGVGFASALQVCKSREGDCTEHAVLVAALCRAAGIPARVVFGLEYLSGILGGHAWTEVWIEGRWYALDATLGSGSADALHLALGRLALAEGTYGAELMPFINLMSGIEVDVVEVTWQGKKVRLDRPEAVTVTGKKFVNRSWGLALEAPGDFVLKEREPFKGLTDRLLDLKSPGLQRKVKVRADSLLPGQTLDDAIPKDLKTRPVTIDGRAGRLGETSKGKERGLIAFVLDDGDSVFTFELGPFEGEADEKVLQLLLEKVDLDAEDAGAVTPK